MVYFGDQAHQMPEENFNTIPFPHERVFLNTENLEDHAIQALDSDMAYRRISRSGTTSTASTLPSIVDPGLLHEDPSNLRPPPVALTNSEDPENALATLPFAPEEDRIPENLESSYVIISRALEEEKVSASPSQQLSAILQIRGEYRVSENQENIDGTVPFAHEDSEMASYEVFSIIPEENRARENQGSILDTIPLASQEQVSEVPATLPGQQPSAMSTLPEGRRGPENPTAKKFGSQASTNISISGGRMLDQMSHDENMNEQPVREKKMKSKDLAGAEEQGGQVEKKEIPSPGA